MSDQWRWVYFYDNISIYSFKECSAGQIVWFIQKKKKNSINGRPCDPLSENLLNDEIISDLT